MGTPELSEKKFSVLKEISEAIISTADAAAIAEFMIDLAISHTGAEKGSLMLAEKGEELYIFAARGIDDGVAATYTEKMGEGIAGTVAETRHAVLVNDIDADERFRGKKRGHYKTRSFISCPVVSKNRLLGVLNINDKIDGTPFSEDEFVLLQTIANQAAIALENTFLMSQLKARAAELQEMNEILMESDVVKAEFITRISHDLRTPLNSIKGSIYYLEVHCKDCNREQTEFYRIISEETRALTETVEKLTGFLRDEGEIRIVGRSMVNLSKILNEVSDQRFVKSALMRKNLALVIDSQGCGKEVITDRVRAVQLFIYLIDALSRHVEDGGELRIRIDEDEAGKVMLAIQGKPPLSVQPFLFNPGPFFFSEGEEEEIKLYLVGKLSSLLGWEITTENEHNSLGLTINIPGRPNGDSDVS